jgi:glutathione S-transferase
MVRPPSSPHLPKAASHVPDDLWLLPLARLAQHLARQRARSRLHACPGDPGLPPARPRRRECAAHTQSPDFLKINPNGQIPAIDDDGFKLSESLAINLYLARKHGGPLAPKDAQEEGLAVMWSLWAATACESHALNIQYHVAAYPPEKRKPELVEAAREALPDPFAVLDKALADGGGYVMGGRFTVADINVAEIIRYAKPAPDLFEAAPHVKAWLDACHARPGFRRCGRHGTPRPPDRKRVAQGTRHA